MEKQTCNDCEHFRRHYIFTDGEYRALYYGHCTSRRGKKREADPPACEDFTLKPPPPKDPAKYYIAHIKLIPAED